MFVSYVTMHIYLILVPIEQVATTFNIINVGK
jgi:hypothetical protein